MKSFINLLASAALLAKAKDDACGAAETKSCTFLYDNSSEEWRVKAKALSDYEYENETNTIWQTITIDGRQHDFEGGDHDFEEGDHDFEEGGHDFDGVVYFNDSRVAFSFDRSTEDDKPHLKMDATLTIWLTQSDDADYISKEKSISEESHDNFKGKWHSFNYDGKTLYFQVVTNFDFSSSEKYKVNDAAPTGWYWDHNHADAFIRFQVYDSKQKVWSTQYVSLAAPGEDAVPNYKIYNEVWEGEDCAATYTALSNERPDEKGWCDSVRWNKYDDEDYDILLHEHEDNEVNGAMPAVVASAAAAATLALTAFCAFKAKRQGINDDYFGRV